MLLDQLLAGFQSFPLLPTNKLGPSGADLWVGGFVYGSRTLWVSPTNSPLRLGVSSATTNPIGSYSQRFWGYSFLHWNPGLHSLSHSPVVPPGLSKCICATCTLSPHPLSMPAAISPACSITMPHVLSGLAAVSTPPTSVDECFFFNSLVVELSYSLIFWQFWLLFVFKFAVLVLVMQGSREYLPMPPSWPEVQGKVL